MGTDHGGARGQVVEPVEGEAAAAHQRAPRGRPQLPAGQHALLQEADQVRHYRVTHQEVPNLQLTTKQMLCFSKSYLNKHIFCFHINRRLATI